MNKQTEESAVSHEEDRISELPDEILHCIVRRFALSKRWRSVWSSYPVVEFVADPKPSIRATADLRKFGNATIDRFSRDSSLLMETLNLSVLGGNDPTVDQLLDLALKRKAKEVAISTSNQTLVKIATIPLSKYTDGSLLRTLRLECVEFDDLRFLSKYIASCPLLETLELQYILASCPLLETLELQHIGEHTKTNLQVLNPKNLKTLTISRSNVEEIKIEASRLETLQLNSMHSLSKLELEAPQLNRLEISYTNLTPSSIETVMSKLPSLKSLTLSATAGFEDKRLFSKLEEFKLSLWEELEEIEFDAGPGFSIFELELHPWSAEKLRKCQINNVPATCRWEVHFHPPQSHSDTQCFVGLKRFIARFPRFETVNIKLPGYKVTFKEEKMDRPMRPVAVKHLRIRVGSISGSICQVEFVSGLFWACHPTFFSIIYDGTFCCDFFNLVPRHWLDPSMLKELHQRQSWESELESVEITTPDINTTGERICFKLTWR